MQAFLNGRFPKGVLCIRQQHERLRGSKKKIADGRWKMGIEQPGLARAWLLRPNRDRLPVRLPADGEPSRLAVIWAWALGPRNDELLIFAGDGIFRISVERA
jgi:hypothetical protein